RHNSRAMFLPSTLEQAQPLAELIVVLQSQEVASIRPTRLNSRRTKPNTAARRPLQDKSKMRTSRPLTFVNYQPLLPASPETWTAALRRECVNVTKRKPHGSPRIQPTQQHQTTSRRLHVAALSIFRY